MHNSKTLVQFLVVHIERGEEVFDKGEVGVLIVDPAVRGLLQRFVIKRLILVDLLFKRHIFSGVVAIFIKQQGKQPRHSSVPVPEGMNVEEI